MGKPIGNGLPLGACAGRADLVDLFRERTGYFNTFSSTAMHGAVGMAVLDELQERRLDDHAAEIGAHLKAGIDAIAVPYGRIGAVRQRGLFLAIEWVATANRARPTPTVHGRHARR